jgi:cobalt-zinc-cadmium efflux system membrane fusion protein
MRTGQLFVIIGFAAVAFHYGCRVEKKPSADAVKSNVVTMDMNKQRSIDLKLEVATIQNVRRTIETTGVIIPNETRVAKIRPLSKGRIQTVFVRLGTRVKAGQPLAIVDNIELGELLSEYKTAVAELNKAETAKNLKQHSLDRAKKLIDLGAIAQTEYENREAEYKDTEATLASQATEVDKLKEKIRRFGNSNLASISSSRSTLLAPTNGSIIKLDAGEGEIVQEDQELFTIADLSTVWVEADIREKDLASIRIGLPVKIITEAYPDQSFNTTISSISELLDVKTRTIKVRCELPNSDGRLRLQMFVRVIVETTTTASALMIPSKAVEMEGNRTYVFVAAGPTSFAKRFVTVGDEVGGSVKILDGLRPGEKLVTEGAFVLKSELAKSTFQEEEND